MVGLVQESVVWMALGTSQRSTAPSCVLVSIADEPIASLRAHRIEWIAAYRVGLTELPTVLGDAATKDGIPYAARALDPTHCRRSDKARA